MGIQMAKSPVADGNAQCHPLPSRWFWTSSWASALLPTVHSFEQLTTGTPANLLGAYSWAGFCTALNAAIWIPTWVEPHTIGTDARILGAIFVGFGGILALSLSTHFAEWAGRLAGGNGTYKQIAYIFSLFLAPLALFDGLAAPFAASVLGLICVCLWPLSIIYQLTLFSVAVRAAHHVNWAYSIIIGVTAFALFHAMQFGVGVLWGIGLAEAGIV